MFFTRFFKIYKTLELEINLRIKMIKGIYEFICGRIMRNLVLANWANYKMKNVGLSF